MLSKSLHDNNKKIVWEKEKLDWWWFDPIQLLVGKLYNCCIVADCKIPPPKGEKASQGARRGCGKGEVSANV